MSSIHCPGCGGPAELRTLEGVYGHPVVIDACPACNGLWLDGLEALQLSPGAVLALVRAMDDPQAGQRPPLKAAMPCPRCGSRLAHVQDRQRSTTFTYERCPRGHGRFITFFQFLRSRNFIRELNEEELRTLRARIQSVNCSNCGAPVDVARSSTCAHCQTPISTIEPGQLRLAIDELSQADAARREADPTLPLKLLEQRAEVERALRGTESEGALVRLLEINPGGGLVESVLRALCSRL